MIVETLIAKRINIPKIWERDQKLNFQTLVLAVVPGSRALNNGGDCGITVTTPTGKYTIGCVSNLPEMVKEYKALRRLAKGTAVARRSKYIGGTRIVTFKQHCS